MRRLSAVRDVVRDRLLRLTGFEIKAEYLDQAPSDQSAIDLFQGEWAKARVRGHNFTVSLDGYGAGPRQTLEAPLGVGGEALHDWYVATRTFQQMPGKTKVAGRDSYRSRL